MYFLVLELIWFILVYWLILMLWILLRLWIGFNFNLLNFGMLILLFFCRIGLIFFLE